MINANGKIVNTIGVLYKALSTAYYNFIFTRKLVVGNESLEPAVKGMAACQSISYPLLAESIKLVDFKQADVVVDVGSGFGRLLLYLNYKIKVKRLVGFEINELAVMESRKYCTKKGIDIFYSNFLESDIEGDVYVLFNPFDASMLSEFITNIFNKGKRCKVVFINAYPEHVNLFSSFSFSSLKIVDINKPLKSINNKKIVIVEILNEISN